MYSLKKLAWWCVLLITINEIRTDPINRHRTRTFRSDKTVQVNGTEFNELNCVLTENSVTKNSLTKDSLIKNALTKNLVSKNPITRWLCSSIVEVTCLERSGEIERCEITESRATTPSQLNHSASSINWSIIDKEVFCTSNRPSDDNCYLNIVLDVKDGQRNDLHSPPMENGRKIDSADDLKDSEERLRKARRWMIFSICFLGISAFVIICLPGLFFVVMWIKFMCCTDVADDDEPDQVILPGADKMNNAQ